CAGGGEQEVMELEPMWGRPRPQLAELAFPNLDWLAPKVLAVEFDQVEREQEHGAVLPAVAQPVELRRAVPVAGDRLSVDQARAHPGRAGGLGDERVAVRPVVPVAGEKADAGGAAQFAQNAP